VTPDTQARLFGYDQAFDHPVVRGIVIAVAAALVIAPLLIAVLARLGKIGETKRRDLFARFRPWLVLSVLIALPILAGAAWTILAIGLLSVFCFFEYARATGLAREKAICLIVVLGIVAVNFAVADHYYGFFVALPPLVVGAIAVVAILADRPEGYIQRVALGIFGFMLFGCALGHLAYMANDKDYRPIILMVLLAVELNDVLAYICGNLFGRRKLAPNTSPNKTIGGALGALALTTPLVAVLGHFIFQDTPIDNLWRLIVLGLIVSGVGQFGDLTVSSIKRDLGVKDLGTVIPAHGGLLDRFDSLLLVAPAVFHYVGFYVGFGLDQTPRIFSGS